MNTLSHHITHVVHYIIMTSHLFPSTGIRGCGGWSSTSLPPSYTSSSSTIQQCVEWCRGTSQGYAALSGHDCYCTSTLQDYDMSVDPSLCHTSCPGDGKQICGGTGVMSIFAGGELFVGGFFSSGC